MKKLLLAVAAAAAIATPIALSGGSASAAAGNSTINCNNFGDNNRCTATDPDGLNYIRVIDPATGALVKSIDLACSDNVTKKGFNFPDSGGDHYRIRIADCENNTDTYGVNPKTTVVTA
ncbi:MAG TPA: hypothetical protein VHC63_11230 [Acidimicrobiales bacterium]|nr:hypothetical protein [Acidimicrobiales bacterium]